MPIVPLIFSLGLLVSLPSVFLKLATVLSRKRVSWPHCFVFGSTAAALSLVGRVTWTSIGYVPPLWLALLFGAAVYLSFGSWFLRSRITNRDGRPQGLSGASRVMVVFLMILGLFTGGALLLAAVLRESYLQ